MRALLEQQRREAPWSLGLTLLGLSRRLELSEAAVFEELGILVREGKLELRNGYYAMSGFTPELTEHQRAFFDELFAARSGEAYLPVSCTRVVSAMKGVKIVGLPQAFDMLHATGALIRVADAFYRDTQIARIRAELEALLSVERRVTPARFRDLLGTSRKYAVPLLEWFDAVGVTVRNLKGERCE